MAKQTMDKSKKILISCVIAITCVFTICVIYLSYLIVTYTPEQSISTGNDKLSQIRFMTIVLCVFMLVDLFVAIAYLIILRKKKNSSIYKLAYVDEITGLPSKAKHRQDVEDALANEDIQYAYASFELDNFRYVNDMFGYDYGNFVLKHVAETVESFLYSDELLSRTTGARFGMLIRYDNDDLLKTRLMDIFNNASHLKSDDENTVYTIMFTCGIYRINKDDNASEVRAYANAARESARKLFDNNIEFYDFALQEKKHYQKELEYEMRSAYDNNQFEVYLQPKYTVDGDRIVGAEALIRWNHPTKGIICPNDFIPLFEANGFIVKIDMLVLENVCKCIKNWIDNGIEPIVLSMNLSRIHLYDNKLVSNLVEIADKYKVPHSLIEFELTETAVFDELDKLLKVMFDLKKAGFVLSMDDFGAGYSSLNMLKKLPVDILKLDKGFLDNFKENIVNRKDKTIISHVISMAKALDMEVLVEGVETEMQRDFIANTDCDMIQGYYYAKPMRMKDFVEKYMKTADCIA